MTAFLECELSVEMPRIATHPARTYLAVIGEHARLFRGGLPIPKTSFHIPVEPRLDAAGVMAAKRSVHDVFLVLKRTKPRQISLAGLGKMNSQNVSGRFLNDGKYAARAGREGQAAGSEISGNVNSVQMHQSFAVQWLPSIPMEAKCSVTRYSRRTHDAAGQPRTP